MLSRKQFPKKTQALSVPSDPHREELDKRQRRGLSPAKPTQNPQGIKTEPG